MIPLTSSPFIPTFYEKLLKPSIYVLRRYGLDAQLRPPNDILVRNRKNSGNETITLGEVSVLAGDILIELPIELMTNII